VQEDKITENQTGSESASVEHASVYPNADVSTQNTTDKPCACGKLGPRIIHYILGHNRKRWS